MTFCASRNGALICGSTPYFANIDRQKLNNSPAKFETASKQIGTARAVMPVHFSRLTCDMDAISAIARKYNTVVIEEAAHAIGTPYDDD